jgi:hypothetical protein
MRSKSSWVGRRSRRTGAIAAEGRADYTESFYLITPIDVKLLAMFQRLVPPLILGISLLIFTDAAVV